MKKTSKIIFAALFGITITLVLRDDLLQRVFGNFAWRPFVLVAPAASALSAWLWIVAKNFRNAFLVYLIAAASIFWMTIRNILP